MLIKSQKYFIGLLTILLSQSLLACHFPEEEDTEFGVSATRQDLRIDRALHIPSATEDGKIPTLNQTGFMKPGYNVYTSKFIEFAAQSKYPVADVGAAYGVDTIPAVNKGARVIAIDIEVRHLLLLREQVEEGKRHLLTLSKKRFPNEINFPDNSIGAFLLNNMLHFLEGEEMELAITKIKKELVPGGWAIAITMSPYHYLFKDFLPVYLKNAQEGTAWPGVIRNMHEIAPQFKTQIPNFLHVMDSQSLGKAFQRHGLKIVEEGLFDYDRPNTTKSDGKGYYGIIVEKSTD